VLPNRDRQEADAAPVARQVCEGTNATKKESVIFRAVTAMQGNGMLRQVVFLKNDFNHAPLAVTEDVRLI